MAEADDLVERDREVAELERVIDGALGGEGAVLIIHRPAGPRQPPPAPHPPPTPCTPSPDPAPPHPHAHIHHSCTTHTRPHPAPTGSALPRRPSRHPPGAARRMYPARTSSLWLVTSASAGSSRRVRTNSVDMRSMPGRVRRVGWLAHPGCRAPGDLAHSARTGCGQVSDRGCLTSR